MNQGRMRQMVKHRQFLFCVVKSLMLFSFLFIALSCGQRKRTPDVSSSQSSRMIHFLVPCDSIGVEDGDSTMMFGRIGGCAYTSDNRIAVLDRTLGGVRFYSEAGEYLSSFIPAGNGPGEFLSVDRMSLDALGNLCLASVADKKICIYDSDLNLVRELVFTSHDRGGASGISLSTDTALVMSMMIVTGSDSITTEVALFTDSIQPDLIYRRRTAPLSAGLDARSMTRMDFAVASNGRVYISDYSNEEYEITCYSKEGDSLFTFGIHRYEPVLRSDSLLAEMREEALDLYMAYYGTEEGFDYQPELYWHPVTSIQIDSKDRLWVTGERYIDRAQIFNAKGNLLFNARLLAPEWQNCEAWNIRASPNGVLADPGNPEMYPVVYMLREET